MFNKILQSNIQQLTITGGEALLVNNLAYHLQRCLEKRIRINVFTNGILLNSFIDQLGDVSDKNLLTFEVSIDGGKEEHDFIRGKGNYEITTRNILYALRKGYKITTNTVLNRITRISIVQMMNDLHDMGVSSIQLSNLMLKGWAKDNKDKLYISKEELRDVYKEIIQKIKFPFFYADITNNVYQINGKRNMKKEGKNTWKCCAGQARLTINFDGEVLLCPLCPDYSIGNITQLSLDEIWNNPLRTAFINKLIELNAGKHICFIYDQDIK